MEWEQESKNGNSILSQYFAHIAAKMPFFPAENAETL